MRKLAPGCEPPLRVVRAERAACTRAAASPSLLLRRPRGSLSDTAAVRAERPRHRRGPTGVEEQPYPRRLGRANGRARLLLGRLEAQPSTASLGGSPSLPPRPERKRPARLPVSRGIGGVRSIDAVYCTRALGDDRVRSSHRVCAGAPCRVRVTTLHLPVQLLEVIPETLSTVSGCSGGTRSGRAAERAAREAGGAE